MNAPARIDAADLNAWRLACLLCREAEKDTIGAVAAADFFLQAICDKLPAPDFNAAAPFWSSARHEAALWAEVASGAQVMAMLVACLDRLPSAKALQKDREALLVATFNSLPPDRRAAFLKYAHQNESGK